MTPDRETPGPDIAAREPAGRHLPVMLAEVLAALGPQAGETIVDGTFGAGGYTSAILAAGAEVVAIDRDETAIAAGEALVQATGGRLRLVNGRFGALDQHLADLGIAAVDGVVLDIGVSSMQLDQAERGFSFRNDGPLDMRMGQDGPSAADVVNRLDERDLARIFWVLGEEKRSNALARAIVADRDAEPFIRTRQLAGLAERVVGWGKRRHDDIHPATRAFQALRIFVNGELDELASALAAAEQVLKPGGRLVIVSFHSLEDRIVKRFFADRSRETAGGSRHAPETRVPDPTFRLIEKAAVIAGEAEVAGNPRARSAKLRAGIRTAAAARPIDLAELGVPAVAVLPKPTGAAC
ncbi:MAG: 16S rRNA (cytosine(1402)-N(4))-methyltransferase RsmH [Ancalomicrobiaceae bacterium]|nr:16S rRNA (cytosine(1402)-N(4))-methyltransferase RsmH [Ancalomicrobiaceae bacterium]